MLILFKANSNLDRSLFHIRSEAFTDSICSQLYKSVPSHVNLS